MAKKRSVSKGEGTPTRKKPVEDDNEADKMEMVTGMTSFREYNYSLMRATEVSVGQKWNEDRTGEVTILRDKKGKMVATWTGREDKVGKDDQVMRVHEMYAKKVQEAIDKVQKERIRHRRYSDESQMWLEGVTNPRWTENE